MLGSAPEGYLPSMELTQLEFFLMVVEESSFSKAAVRVFRTQPAVSIADITMMDANAPTMTRLPARSDTLPLQSNSILSCA